MIKIQQINNSLSIKVDKELHTIDKDKIDIGKLFEFATKYNQTNLPIWKNKVLKLIPTVEKNTPLKEVIKHNKKKRILLDETLIDHSKEFEEFLSKTEFKTSYLNFWEKLAKNPIKHVKENFFKYMKNNKLRVTPSGNIVAYRYVKSPKINLERIRAVNEAYIKVKNWKKSPKNYYLDDDLQLKGFYNSFKININLEDEYLDQKVTFTSSQNSAMKYNIGQIHTMDWEEADTSTATCSRGFHFTNYQGLSAISGYNFGDQLIIGLINPSKICAIPFDNYPKFRCVEWYFASIIDKKFVDELENSDLSIFDVDFVSKEENIVLNKKELRKHYLSTKPEQKVFVNTLVNL